MSRKADRSLAFRARVVLSLALMLLAAAALFALVAGFLASPANAHELGEEGKEAPISQEMLDEALGSNAEPAGDGLYEIPINGGPDLLTHGPDLQLDEPQVRDAGLSAGDPERPPVCATSSYQQVLYARPVTRADRLASVREPIRAAMRRTNALLNQDSLDSGGPTADYKVLCDSNGEISIQGFISAGSTFNQIVTSATLAGYNDPDVDYTIFYDDPAADSCGVGSYYEDESLSADNDSNFGGGYAVSYSSCWYGETPMHENGHNQGAVQSGAPYSTGTGGHCYDEEDVMCYSPDGGNVHQGGTINRCTDGIHFDCGYDTYFDTAPEPGEYLATHWNIGSTLNRFLTFGGGGVTSPGPNTVPGAGFEFSCARLSCDFSDTSSDSDGSIASRSWSFGDGATTNGASPRHDFASAGTFQVRLTVTDDDGATDSIVRSVKVDEGSKPGPPRQLRAGSSHSARSGAAGSWDYYSVPVKRGAKTLQVRLAGPDCRRASCDPDLDLYVRRNAEPTLDSFSCRPRLVGSRESCKIAKPRAAKWFVGVHVYAGSSPVTYSISAKVKKAHKKHHRRHH